jgi:hypothetical protein
MEADPAFA